MQYSYAGDNDGAGLYVKVISACLEFTFDE